jgi:dihydrofolate reductase
MGVAVGDRMGEGCARLFGRRSYADMHSHWIPVGGPFKDGLSNATKYVASSSLHTERAWPNSTLLTGDVPAAVAALREQPGGNLVIMGSGG